MMRTFTLAISALLLAPSLSHASIRRDKNGKQHSITSPGKLQPRYKGVKLDGKRIGLPLKKSSFTPAKTKQIENAAIRFATKKIGGAPVFLGNVNNDTPRLKILTKQGVLVSTGDENSKVQFGVWRVLIDKSGKPTSLKQL